MPATPLSNVLVVIISGTTSATVGTQTSHAHGGGTIPRWYTLRGQANGIVYESIPPDQTNIYLKGSAASLNFIAHVYF